MRTVGALALAALALQAQWPGPASRLVGEERTRLVERGESWASIGARAGVTAATLARRNGRSPGSRPREGEPIVIDNRHLVPQVEDASIVINVPQRLLFQFANGVRRAHYPIGRR